MRGENLSGRLSTYAPRGTSPHAWGKLDKAPLNFSRKRNIPTCVGKTSLVAHATSVVTEHPHMRGENTSSVPSTPERSGTSPHAWGKHQDEANKLSIDRNIPTCVGKTMRSLVIMIFIPEHPHMRGENLSGEGDATPCAGTSPHAWGKHLAAVNQTIFPRNIPTCVGKTNRRRQRCRESTEHPHMRGENVSRPSRPRTAAGTSPHAWGKRVEADPYILASRNIPTCVGKTTRSMLTAIFLPEHPHMRGENLKPPALVDAVEGTSPHAWGKPPATRSPFAFPRNIPTCVGKTVGLLARVRRAKEHPHMRGENG